MAAALRAMPFPATAAAAAMGLAFVMRVLRTSDPDNPVGPVHSQVPQQTFGHSGPQNMRIPNIYTHLISTSTITEMATIIRSSTLTSTVTETPSLAEAVSHAFTRGSITQMGNLIPATGLGLLFLLLLWALATIFISALRRAGRSNASAAPTKTWWFQRLHQICEQSSKCHACPRYDGEKHHVCGDTESAFMTALQRLQTNINLLQKKVDRMDTHLAITTNRLEEMVRQLQAPARLPTPHTSFDPPGRTEPASRPPKLASDKESSDTGESASVKINLPALDSDHWLARVLKISWASFNLGQRKTSPGDFDKAGGAGLDCLSNELDQDYYETSIRDIVKEACEQPDLLLDPESRIRQMQKRVTDIERTYSAYIQAYGYSTPTITFSADDAYKGESDSDIDDRFEDERSARPALPASASMTRTKPVENQSSNGGNRASKTWYERSSTDAKAEPVGNKARYGGGIGPKTRDEQSSTDAKAEFVGRKARYGGGRAPKTRYELESTETKSEPVATKYSNGNRISSKTQYKKESTETRAESSSEISKTARYLGSSAISHPRQQQRRRSSGISNQATVEDVESRKNDMVDSSLLDPPDLDDFDRGFSSARALTTKILKQLMEGDQQERRRQAGEQQKSMDVAPVNPFYQATPAIETLPKADASAKSAPTTLAPSIPVRRTSTKAVPPKLPAKKAAIKEVGRKQSIPKTTTSTAIFSKKILPTRILPTGSPLKESRPDDFPAKEIPPERSPAKEASPKKRSGKHVRIVTPPRSLNLRSDDNYLVSTNRIRGDAHSNGQTAGEIFLTVFPDGARTLPTSSQGLRCGIHAMAKYISMLCPNVDEGAIRSQLVGIAMRDPLLKAVDESRSGFDQIHLDQILQEWNKENNMRLRLCIVLESDQVNPDGSFVATLHIPGVENQREDLEPTSPIRTVFIHNDNVEMIAPGRGLMNHWRALTSVSGPVPTLPPVKQPVHVSANDSFGQPSAAGGATFQPAAKADVTDTHIDKPTGGESILSDESKMQGIQETGQGLVLPESGGPLPVPLQVASASAAHGPASIFSAGGFGTSHGVFEASAHTHVFTTPLPESGHFSDAMELEKTEAPRIEHSHQRHDSNMSITPIPESGPYIDAMELEKREAPQIEHSHQRHDSNQGMTGVEFTESSALHQQIQIGTLEYQVVALPTTAEVEMSNSESIAESGYDDTPHDHDSLFSSPPETPPPSAAGTVPVAEGQEQKKMKCEGEDETKTETKMETTGSILSRLQHANNSDLRTIQDTLLGQADALAQERVTEAKARKLFPYASPRDKKGPNLFNTYLEWSLVPHTEVIKFTNALPELVQQNVQSRESAVALAEECLDDLKEFHERTKAQNWRDKEHMKVALTDTTWKLRKHLQKLR